MAFYNSIHTGIEAPEAGGSNSNEKASIWQRAVQGVSFSAQTPEPPSAQVPLWKRAKQSVQKRSSGVEMLQQLVASAQSSHVLKAQHPFLAAMATVRTPCSSHFMLFGLLLVPHVAILCHLRFPSCRTETAVRISVLRMYDVTRSDYSFNDWSLLCSWSRTIMPHCTCVWVNNSPR